MADSSAMGIDALLGVISNQQTAKGILFSSLAILVYDHILLLPLEIAKVWKANWTPVKTLYIANRIINWLVVIFGFASKILSLYLDFTVTCLDC